MKLLTEHHKHVRTSNLLKHLFGENRRLVKMIPHFVAEKAGMKLVSATMLAASAKWRVLKMASPIGRQVDELWQQVFSQTPLATWAVQLRRIGSRGLDLT